MTIGIKKSVVGGFKLDVKSARVAIEQTLKAQWKRRFDTAGASDGAGYEWPKLRAKEPSYRAGGSPLRDKGTLMRTTVTSAEPTTSGFTVTFGSAMKDAIIPNVHQEGVKKPILPKPPRKFLFIPLSMRGARSMLVGKKRVGQRKTKDKKTGITRISNVTLEHGKDFILVKGIFPTAEKGGYAIQPRPIARLTPDNLQEITQNVADAIVRSR